MAKRKSRAIRMPTNYHVQPASNVSLAKMGGDHGTGTAAAMAGKVLKPILNDDGRNPNNVGRMVVEDQLARMDFLSMRQYQAGMEIRNAWSGVEKLSSGGELKEQVDSTPKPDATIAIQMDAQSRLVNAMRAVPHDKRGIVEHVCWHNQPLIRMGRGSGYYRRQSELQDALELVANHLRY